MFGRILCFVACLLCLPVLVHAQSSQELKARRQKIEREIEVLQQSLNNAAKNRKLTAGEVAALGQQIELRREKINVINGEIGALSQEIKTNTGTVHKLQTDLEELKREYAQMVRFAQKNANAYDKMMFVFGAESFNQAFKRVKYMQQISDYRQTQAQRILGTKTQISHKIVELDRTKREKNALLADQEQERRRLDADRQDKAAKAEQLARQEKKFKGDIAQRKTKARQLDRQIRVAINREIEAARRRAEEEERRRLAALEAARVKAAREAAARAAAANRPVEKAPTPATPVRTAPARTSGEVLRASPEAARLSAGFENNRGSLPYPVAAGNITEGFGTHKVDQASYTNDGVTFTTAVGAGVRAVFEGEVSAVGNNMGRYFVLLKHGEYFTIYSNLSSVSVSRGQKVATRQNIGTVGTTDGAGMLEFKISKVTTYLNPQAWLAR